MNTDMTWTPGYDVEDLGNGVTVKMPTIICRCRLCGTEPVNPPQWLTCAGCFPRVLATLPAGKRAKYAARYGPPGFRAP